MSVFLACSLQPKTEAHVDAAMTILHDESLLTPTCTHRFGGTRWGTRWGSSGDSLVFWGTRSEMGCVFCTFWGGSLETTPAFYNIKKGSEVMGWAKRGEDVEHPSFVASARFLKI